MSTYFKRTFELTDEEKRKVSEMTGKMMLWMLEGRSTGYISKNLNLHPRQVEENFEETLFVLLKQVGWKRYLKVLFHK